MKQNGKLWMVGLALAVPLAVQAQTYTRTEQIVYHDNTSKWVLGQVAKVTCVAPTTALPTGCGPSGTVMSETTYDPTYALPLTSKSFGRLKQTLTYNTDGTVATVKDGNNNITTLSSWKRGIPQSIKYPITPESPAGATQSAVVNDAGWITSVTDENSYKTCYGYDSMGRVNLITHPSETVVGVCDASAWKPTTITFAAAGNAAAYGMPAGHWRQTTLTGNARKILIFDALWRPVVEQTLDLGNVSGTLSEVIKRYDAEGRLEFQSYPINTNGLANYADPALKGFWTEYDALGRVTSTSQDSEHTTAGNPNGLLTTLTEYLPGFQTRVTNPKLQQTTTSYLAYDQPSYDLPVAITHPGGAFTDIARDVFGKPTSIKRRNGTGSVSVTRSITYGGVHRLCTVTEPETNTTVFWYDGAENLIRSAGGLIIPAGTSCSDAKVLALASGRTVFRTYDARNRVKTLTFPDGNGNQSWTYAPDGLPTQITTANNAGATSIVNTSTYNKRRLLLDEIQGQAGWATMHVVRNYNANGHLSSLAYPATYSGLVVDFAPNALGQPTKAGTFVTNASYYPNGALKQFTYGNGIVHTMTQNARQLPSRSTDCTLAGTCAVANRRLDLGYAYDKNANVSAITDYTSAARQTRAMTYDNLDRLTQTTSTMFGTATYGYNVLDNLTTLNVTGGSSPRNHTYVYDANNRLTNVKLTATGTTVIGLGYDAQGNLNNKNGQLYTFDLGNRLRDVPGKETDYRYDAYGRRAVSYLAGAGSGHMRSYYATDGQLLYQQDQRSAKRTDYIYLGGSLVAMRERPFTGETVTVKYQHTDALGSPIAVTDASKAIVETKEYEPFGQQVNLVGPPKDGPGYTGHVQDAATGLTYMQQRYYDPLIGRMLSVDPVTAYSSGDMRHFNVYAYAFNNPYRFTDPDGRQSQEKDEGNFWVGVAKGVRDAIAPIAHAIADPYGNNIDPSYDRIGPGEGQVEKGGYKFGGALAAAEGLKLPAKGTGVLAKGETAVSLTEGQAKNLARFDSKLPAANTGTTVTQTGKGVTFTSDVPGNVPGSKATYQKTVDASGTTTGYTKTTVAPNSQVIHVKDKLNP